MRGCVSNRSRPPTRTSRKTPCFMCFFEQDRCRARVTRRIDAASVRNIRPRHRGVAPGNGRGKHDKGVRSEEHTSELQSLMSISYAVLCLKKKTNKRLRTMTNIYQI